MFAFTVSLLIFLAVFSHGCVEVMAVERTVGVKVGSKVRYGEFLALWFSYNPTATPSPDLTEVNNTLWIENTVLSISGTSVTFESLTHYKNGSDVVDVAQVDVRTGAGIANMTFVSAGLAEGDSVYTLADFASARINATFLRGYVGLMRETGLLNVTHTSVGIETTEFRWTEFFWDTVTGVLVEQFWSFAGIDQAGYLTVASTEYKMIDNNIWLGVPDDVPPVAVAGADQVVELDVSVVFDGGGSRDNVGLARFFWDFNDGQTGPGVTVSHAYAKAGVYNVTLTVEDGKGNVASDFLIVTVKEAGNAFQVPAVVGVIALVAVLFFVWVLFRRR